jgi:hypothetical protein
MKKQISSIMAGLVALGLVVMAQTQTSAAFTSKPPLSVITAGTSVGGTATTSIVSALVKNVSDNATVGAISWTGVNAGDSWKTAAQYIELKTSINVASAGVQFYTDNTNGAAVPRFTGSVSSFTATPAGLVDTIDTTTKLPTAWRASSFTIAGIVPTDPNANAGESYLWFFHEDKLQVAVPSLNAGLFNNADAFVTVYAAPGTILGGQSVASPGGIHFAQNPNSFGGYHINDTTYIYIEADFTSSLVGRSYGTNRMILEAFTL